MALRFDPSYVPAPRDRRPSFDEMVNQPIAAAFQGITDMKDARRLQEQRDLAMRIEKAKVADTMAPEVYHELFGPQGNPSQPGTAFKSIFQNKNLPIGPTLAAAGATDAYPNTTWGRNQIKLLHDKEDRDLNRRNTESLIDQRNRSYGANGTKLPVNYRWTADGMGMEPIPGSPADAKVRTEAEKSERFRTGQVDQANLAITKIDQALSKASGWNTGGMAATKNIPFVGQATGAVDLDADLETIKALLSFDQLKEMKAQSKAGASGLGALSDREMKLLMAARTNLEQAQNSKQLIERLGEVKKHYQNWLSIEGGKDPYGGGGGGPKAKTIKQNGFTYTLNESTGQYE